jgi:hypothetical protein
MNSIFRLPHSLLVSLSHAVLFIVNTFRGHGFRHGVNGLRSSYAGPAATCPRPQALDCFHFEEIRINPS